MHIAEDLFWENEEKQYMFFKQTHSNLNYNTFFPEKTYPAYLTALLIKDLVKNLSYPIVLEPGCGLAICLFFLADMNIKSVGLEISNNALKFAKILQREFVSPGKAKNVSLMIKNFYKFPPNKNFSVVFNSGVLEHFSKREQIYFINWMKDHSSKWIVIMIPNIKSLVFKNFVRQMKRQSRKYSLRHRQINVEVLFKKVGIKLIRKTGRNLWLSNYQPRNKKLKSVYKKHFNWLNEIKEFSKKEIIKLTDEERKISDKILHSHAFTQIYIGEVQ